MLEQPCLACRCVQLAGAPECWRFTECRPSRAYFKLKAAGYITGRKARPHVCSSPTPFHIPDHDPRDTLAARLHVQGFESGGIRAGGITRHAHRIVARGGQGGVRGTVVHVQGRRARGAVSTGAWAGVPRGEE